MEPRTEPPHEPWTVRGELLSVVLALLVGACCGGASALFLWLLDGVTALRVEHPRLTWALPAAGAVIGLAYARWGARARGGASLLIDTFHDGGAVIPLRMAPMVLLGTLVTHLFGGSAGREGTAVQMGTSLADNFAARLRVDALQRRGMIVAGMAGGFGSVFGTPLAGALFGVEVVRPGAPRTRFLLPAVVASFTGDVVARALGTGHADYPQVPLLDPTLDGTVGVLLLALACGAVALLFMRTTHAVKALCARFPDAWMHPVLGGVAVVVTWNVLGSDDYLGLGVPVILRAFEDGGVPAWAFLAKLGFTAVTVGSGFIGGEVTPLFFVGACLGNALAAPLGLPLVLAAALGLAAVFGACANTPLALAVMAAEVCGWNVFPWALPACLVAWMLTGHAGIYAAQLRHARKPRMRSR